MNFSSPSVKKRTVISAGIVLAIVLLSSAAFLFLRQPSLDDYKTVRDTRIKELTAASSGLQPSVNTYLASFKAAYNESGSRDSAATKSKPQYDAYKASERKVKTALESLTANRIANVGDTANAVDLLKQDYTNELTYYGGMVDDYAEYTVLFSDKEQRCSGIFVGETTNLADRRKQVDAAAEKCFKALNELKKSRNTSFVDYAKKVERRVKQIQSYAATTQGAEAKVKGFESEMATFQKRAEDAKARNAPEAEVLALADEIKDANSRIQENKSEFDYAASRYLSTIKEMPALYGAVYETSVPAKVKYFHDLIEGRTNVLKLLVEAKITT